MKNNNMRVHHHYTSSSTNSTSRNPPIFYPSSLQAKQPASSWGLASASWQEEKEGLPHDQSQEVPNEGGLCRGSDRAGR